jgi:hypothetical protein
MGVRKVNIDFKVMQQALKQNVRDKAIKAESTIVYLKNGRLIEEDPKTSSKRTLKKEYSL